MMFGIHSFEPLLLTRAGDLEDLAREIISRSAAMGGQLHPLSQGGITDLLRLINSYYSNLIEGNSTHPVDIERAMQNDYDTDTAKRNLQMESLAHIKCQKQIEEKLGAEPALDPSSPDFIRWIHRSFYDELPPPLKQVQHTHSDEILSVVGGVLRHRDIQVGRHIGPPPDTVPSFLKRFGEVYKKGDHHGITSIIHAASAHHRLMWIHPFLDGNGRVARLYTDACLRSVPVAGYGIWNISRGLARNREDYMAALSRADAPKRNDYDGRGPLSRQGLVDFVTFFQETCLEQIDYMNSLLQLDGLLKRITGYVQMRKERLIPAPRHDNAGLKMEAAKILQAVLLRGELPRGEAALASGLKRSGRDILAQLLREGLLVSDMPKSPVRLGYPTHVAGYLFPDLYPVNIPG